VAFLSDSPALNGLSSTTPEKPDFLYHGSCSPIEDCILSPRPKTGDYNGEFPDGERKLVFATSDRSQAILYTTKTPDQRCIFNYNDVPVAVFTNYKHWCATLQQADCALYKLPSDTFRNTISKSSGHPTTEWVSEVAVQGTKTLFTPDDVMKETGAQLFFLAPEIDPQLWNDFNKRLIDASGHNGQQTLSGLDIITALSNAGLIEHHLNKDRDIKPITLPAASAPALDADIAWLKTQVMNKKDISRARRLPNTEKFALRVQRMGQNNVQVK